MRSIIMDFSRYMLSIGLSVTLPCTTLHAQLMHTKDGYVLGERSSFMRSCIEEAGKELVNMAGVSMDPVHYCNCICDGLLPNVTIAELQGALKKGSMAELVLDDRFFGMFMDCATATAQYDEELDLSTLELTGLGGDIYLKECERGANAELPDTPMAKVLAARYCACTLDQFRTTGITYGELQLVEREDGRAFNELVMPCLNMLVHDMQLLVERDPDAIHGPTERSVVPLVDLMGRGFNVKLIIGGVVRYFLLDTGASDLIIGDDLERELVRKGIITKEHYLGTVKTYELADGSHLEARMVLVNEVAIGDYLVRNVLVAVVDGGSLLCGRSFLDKFSHWDLRGASKELLLQR